MAHCGGGVPDLGKIPEFSRVFFVQRPQVGQVGQVGHVEKDICTKQKGLGRLKVDAIESVR